MVRRPGKVRKTKVVYLAGGTDTNQHATPQRIKGWVI